VIVNTSRATERKCSTVIVNYSPVEGLEVADAKATEAGQKSE